MELRLLHYFVAVATERNITKAAESLHISQPALSKQLKELEEEVGQILFLRGNRQITLTSEGEYFLSKAKEILGLVDRTLANLQEQEIISGELHIGAAETAKFQHLMDIVARIQQEAQAITTHITSGNADDMMLKLDAGLIDFALVMGHTDKRKYNFLSLPWQDTWGLLVNKAHPLSQKAFIKPDDLKTIPLATSSQSGAFHPVEEWLGYGLDQLHIVGTFNLLYNASLMAKSNLACVLGVDGIVNTADSDLTFLPLKPQVLAPLTLIWKRNQPLSKLAKKFLEEVEKSLIE